jgi:hypothetical protein
VGLCAARGSLLVSDYITGLENPNKQDDDDDEEKESSTDIHGATSFLHASSAG